MNPQHAQRRPSATPRWAQSRSPGALPCPAVASLPGLLSLLHFAEPVEQLLPRPAGRGLPLRTVHLRDARPLSLLVPRTAVVAAGQLNPLGGTVAPLPISAGHGLDGTPLARLPDRGSERRESIHEEIALEARIRQYTKLKRNAPPSSAVKMLEAADARRGGRVRHPWMLRRGIVLRVTTTPELPARRRHSRLIAALTSLIGACASAAGDVYGPIAAADPGQDAVPVSKLQCVQPACPRTSCSIRRWKRTWPAGRRPSSVSRPRPAVHSPRGASPSRRNECWTGTSRGRSPLTRPRRHHRTRTLTVTHPRRGGCRRCRRPGAGQRPRW